MVGRKMFILYRKVRTYLCHFDEGDSSDANGRSKSHSKTKLLFDLLFGSRSYK